MIWQERQKSFDFLHSILGANEKGIRGIDHNEVFRTQKSDVTTAFGECERVLRVHGGDVSSERISFFVGG